MKAVKDAGLQWTRVSGVQKTLIEVKALVGSVHVAFKDLETQPICRDSSWAVEENIDVRCATQISSFVVDSDGRSQAFKSQLVDGDGEKRWHILSANTEDQTQIHRSASSSTDRSELRNS